MTTLLLLLLATEFVAALITGCAIRRAPIGYEDETGFHYGRATGRRSGTWRATWRSALLI